MGAKKCISCGMPMEKEEDFAAKDTNKDYCCYCARPDGSMKSWEEALRDGTQFAMKRFQIGEDEARRQVEHHMKTLPAWERKK